MFILNNKPVFMVSVTQMKMGEAKFDPFYQNPIKKLSVQASTQCLVAFEQIRMTIDHLYLMVFTKHLFNMVKEAVSYILITYSVLLPSATHIHIHIYILQSV